MLFRWLELFLVSSLSQLLHFSGTALFPPDEPEVSFQIWRNSSCTQLIDITQKTKILGLNQLENK